MELFIENNVLACDGAIRFLARDFSALAGCITTNLSWSISGCCMAELHKSRDWNGARRRTNERRQTQTTLVDRDIGVIIILKQICTAVMWTEVNSQKATLPWRDFIRRWWAWNSVTRNSLDNCTTTGYSNKTLPLAQNTD